MDMIEALNLGFGLDNVAKSQCVSAHQLCWFFLLVSEPLFHYIAQS